MKKTLLLLLLAGLLSLLAACGREAQAEEENQYRLYYPVAQLEEAAGADAIVAREIVIDGAEQMDAETLSAALLRKLLGPAPDAGVASPGRNGVTLRGVSIAGKWAQVDFSRAYASLEKLDLTLADCCVALTLTQLEEVNAVTITVEGRPVPQRGERTFVAADALLATTEEAPRPITASLYFYDPMSGDLRAERRALSLYEGQTRTDALLGALLQGPESAELLPLLPEEFAILSAKVEEGTCYLNLSGDTRFEGNGELAIESLVASLCSLKNVERVQIVVDGELWEELDGVPVLQPRVFSGN